MMLPRLIVAKKPRPALLVKWLVTVIITLLVVLPGDAASAHANLLRSEPTAGAALPKSPDQVVLEFSENVDPSFTNAKLLDENAQVLVKGPGEVDPANPAILRLKLSPLPDGVYSVVWRARSVDDGHVTGGTVGFSVGEATPHASMLPPYGTPDPATALPQPIDSFSRWLGYLTLAVMLGGASFALLVWRPGYRRWDDAEASSDAYATRLLQHLIQLGAYGLIIATLAFALVQTAQASGAEMPALLGEPLLTFAATRSGLLLAGRIVVAALIAVLSRRLPATGQGRAAGWWAVAGGGLVALMTFSLQSHAAAQGEPLGVVADSLHLAAVVTWVGGLAPLAILLGAAYRRESPVHLPPLNEFIPRFSLLTLVSVNLLVVSGLYSALVEVQSIDGLTATSYGRLVLLKSVLLALLLVLGSINLLILTPRLSQPESKAGSWLRWTTRIELSLGVLVLIAAGVLTSLAPAFSALEAHQQLGFIADHELGGVWVLIRIEPAKIGYNEFGLDAVDNRPNPDHIPLEVDYFFFMTDRNIGYTKVQATTSDHKRFTVAGNYLTLAGKWRVEALVKRSDIGDIIFVFDLSIQAGPNSAEANPILGSGLPGLPSQSRP